MSRAFVKEPDGDQADGQQPELPQSPHPNFVTPSGLRQLKERLAALGGERRGLKAAAGDLAGQSHLGRVEQEIRYLEERLRRALPVDPAGQPADKVAFAATVTLEDDSGGCVDYTIVGEDEADPAIGKVSWVSPLARALQDAEAGDLVTWRRPAGDLELEVIAIRYSES
jgi:transcription elongation GreA/GreB family factor